MLPEWQQSNHMNMFPNDQKLSNSGPEDIEHETSTLRPPPNADRANQCALRCQLKEIVNRLSDLAERLRKSRAAEKTLKARIANDACTIAGLREKLTATQIALAESTHALRPAEQNPAAETTPGAESPPDAGRVRIFGLPKTIFRLVSELRDTRKDGQKSRIPGIL